MATIFSFGPAVHNFRELYHANLDKLPAGNYALTFFVPIVGYPVERIYFYIETNGSTENEKTWEQSEPNLQISPQFTFYFYCNGSDNNTLLWFQIFTNTLNETYYFQDIPSVFLYKLNN